MSLKKRLEVLLRKCQPEEPPIEFEFLIAPDGLTREEHQRWLEQQPPDGFTFDIGGAGVKGGKL